MDVYNKLFTKILDSSIWLEPTTTRIVWMTFIASMDEDGFVAFAAPGNVAGRARVTIEEAAAALEALEGPDPNSSDPDNDGRRIERVQGGWMVLNAGKYRAITTRIIEKEQTRQRVARHRAKKKAVTNCNAGVTHANVPVTTSESETEEEVHPKQVAWRGEEKCYRRETRLVLAYLNEKAGRHYREVAANLDLIDARLSEDGITFDGVKQMLDRQRSRWKGTPQWEFFRPATLFAPSKFDGYYAGREEPLPVDSKQAAKISDAKQFVASQFK